jgi:hypothetical protein
VFRFDNFLVTGGEVKGSVFAESAPLTFSAVYNTFIVEIWEPLFARPLRLEGVRHATAYVYRDEIGIAYEQGFCSVEVQSDDLDLT